MSVPNPWDVLIIGAGIAGLTLAQRLQTAGLQVLVIDKSRGVGGRLATRRVGEDRLDHGLPYLEIQGPHTAAMIAQWLGRDLIQPLGDLVTWSPSQGFQTDNRTLWSSTEGINSIAKHIAQNLTIARDQRAIWIRPQADHWQIGIEHQTHTHAARTLVLTQPAPQAGELVAPLPWGQELKNIPYEPCIAVLAGYGDPLSPAWSGCTWDHPTLAWTAWEHHKRRQGTTLLIQSSAAYAQDRFDHPNPHHLGHDLIAQLRAYLPEIPPHPLWLQVHRWRYARCQNPLGDTPLLLQNHPPLWYCGDGCGDRGLEGAIANAHHTADRLLQSPFPST